MSVVGAVLFAVLEVFFVILLARFVFDWVFVLARNWRPRGPVVLLLEVIYTVTDPPLKALRRVIPPLRLGNFAIDIAFLILIIGVQILAGVARQL
ncbi:MAG: YggT family protein [Frankiales bacterium]|nr:YggT family protein [Frankiales bacterium]